MPNVRFELRHGVSGTDRDEWIVYAIFDNGKDAAQAKATVLCPRPEHVWAIVRVSEAQADEGDVNWREREAQRFDDGRYKRVPWSGIEDGADYTTAYPGHFVHIAEGDTRKVAFTPDDAAGRKGRKTVLAPDVYLERFYNASALEAVGKMGFWMSADMIKSYASAMCSDGSNVHFATTADDIQAAYERMRRESAGHEVLSCMTYPAGDFSTGGIHPVRMYAAGDLALAYVEDADGRVYGRALVWPERKIWGRMYGNGSLVLRAGLRGLGYTNGGNEALQGARLLKQLKSPHKDDSCYIMPYIDGSQRFSDAGDHFIIDDCGPYAAERTDGLAYTFEVVACDRCSEDVAENDTVDVQGDTWCHSCAEDTFSCGECSERVPDGDGNEARDERGWSTIICNTCANDSYTYVDREGIYVHDSYVSQCTDCEESALPSDINGNGVCEGCQELRDEAEAEALAESEASDTQPELSLDNPPASLAA